MASNILTLDLDVGPAVLGTREVTGALGGLDKALTSLGHKLAAVLAGAELITFLQDAVKATGKLDKQFLVMRLALGKLRVAIGDALVPIAEVLIPILNDAIFAAIRFVKYIGKIIRALLGVSDTTRDAADAEEALADAAVSTSKAVQRSLAGFDQINRLNGSSGGSISVGAGKVTVSRPDNYELDLEQFLLVGKIKELLRPLQEIDLTPVTKSLEELYQAVRPITRQLFDGLEWAWHNLFMPLAKWTIEELLPAFLDMLTAAMQALGDTIEACKPALSWLWENFLLPVARWTGQAILDALGWLREKLNGISQWMQENEVSVEQLLGAAAAAVAILWLINTALDGFNLRGNTGTETTNLFGGALSLLQSPFTLVIGLVAALTAGVALLVANWDTVSSTAQGAWKGVKNAWSGAWSWFQTNVLSPLQTGFRSTINGIIGFFNGLISGAVAGLNAIVRSVNKLSFTVPDWVPEIGGEKFGFNLKTVSAPKIPYLAQGAVLPANKPFLAVVGDQRHGTNVEAPLTTIQEAVGLVMEDMIASNLAGQETIVGVLRQILEAVLGIRIGDGDIARAVDRYRSKMAVVKGGLF